MGEQNGAAPAATTDTSAQSAPSTSTSGTQAVTVDPTWLNDRLERAKRVAAEEALKAAGFSTIDEAKAAKSLAEAQKTEAQKQAERLKVLEPEAEKAKVYAERLVKYAEAELARLTDSQKSAVLGLAGDDLTKVPALIDALRPTWTTVTNSPAAPAASPAPTVQPTAASTAPPRDAPSSTTTSNPSKIEVYKSLQSKNPFAAAEYLDRHYGDLATELFPTSR